MRRPISQICSIHSRQDRERTNFLIPEFERETEMDEGEAVFFI